MKTFKNYGHQGDLNFRKIEKLPVSSRQGSCNQRVYNDRQETRSN